MSIAYKCLASSPDPDDEHRRYLCELPDGHSGPHRDVEYVWTGVPDHGCGDREFLDDTHRLDVVLDYARRLLIAERVESPVASYHREKLNDLIDEWEARGGKGDTRHQRMGER